MKTLKRVFLICGTLPFMFSCTDSVIDSYIESIGGNPNGEVSQEEIPVLETYDWPTEAGQAKISEHYKVFVSLEGEEEKEIEVLQSDPIVEHIRTDGTYGEDFHAEYTKQRTFSFVPVSYDENKEKKLKFRIESLDSYTNPVLSPKSYNITPDEVSGNSVSFTVDKANRYICVNFDCEGNIVKHPNAETGWIKHMLMIYVDSAETFKPNLSRQKVVYYSDEITDADLAGAEVIYFKPGYYNLKDNPTGSMINEHGGLTLTSNQQLYIAGGAFVEGYVLRKNFSDVNQAFYGRGILSGRQYTWQPGNDNRLMGQLMMGAMNSVFDGLIVMESPHHGIVTREGCTFKNIKFLGWHCNNDGLRPGSSKIENCFIRACDDFFYNYSLDVKNCVLWPCFNGSIMTNGWNSIDIGGSLMENIDIIYTEWIGLGNNKGLIMSQNNYMYNPPIGSATTKFRDIRFEGKISGFVNLKPNENSEPLENAADLGWMGNILLENISIDEHGDKPINLVKGGKPAVKNDPNSIWWVKDVTFRNVTIGGVKVTDENKNKWFSIDENTTQNIVFE